MSYNGSGTFNINSTGQPVVAGTVITASAFNALTTDLATGLTTAITKDGQTTTTARITFAQGITSSLVTDSSSVSTGSIITAGGAGIAKNLYVGVNANVAGTLGVTGVATFSAAPIYSSLTASSAVATDASKGLVSVTNTGTGNNVLATSPTITTPTISSLSSAAATALTLQSAGTTAITATTAQNVGIGTASPANKLHVSDTTTSTVKTRTEASTGYVDVGMGGNSGVFDTTGSDGIRLRMSGNDKVSIDGSTLALPGLQGIKFQATQSASSDANTLDDYEEGTWTPTDTSGAGLSFTGVVAQYVKVGSMLVAQMSITYPTTANGNQAAIGGLPFTTANFDNAGGFNRYGTNAAYIFPTVSANGTSGSLFTIGGTGVSNVSLSAKRVDFTYVYRTT